MNTNRQCFRHYFATNRTYLTGALGLYFNHYPISFHRFIGQIPKEYAPTRIHYRFTQISIMNHIPNSQILYVYGFIVFNIAISKLMQEIISLVGYFLIYFSYQYTSFVSSIRALLSSC